MRTYTIDGIEHIAYDGKIYELGDPVEDINNLEDSGLYLHNKTIGVFKLQDKSYSTFDAVFESVETDYESKEHYSEENDEKYNFSTARPLEPIQPDQSVDCQNCGDWVYSGKEVDTPYCFDCGTSVEVGNQ